MDRFTDRAGGLFIWASTAADFILKAPIPSARFDALMTSTSQAHPLDSLYAKILAMAMERAEDEVYLRKMLQAICAAQEPLPVETLDECLQVPGVMGVSPSAGFIANLSSVLSRGIGGKLVQAMHPTFLEYLQRTPGSEIVWKGDQNISLERFKLELWPIDTDKSDFVRRNPNLSAKAVSFRVKSQPLSSTVTIPPLIGRWLPESRLEVIECAHFCVYQPILTKEDLDNGWRSLGQSLDGTKALVVKEFHTSDPILDGLRKPDTNPLGRVILGRTLSQTEQLDGHVDLFRTYYPEAPQYHVLGSHFSANFRNAPENNQIGGFCGVRSDLLESGEFVDEPLCLEGSLGGDRIFVWRIAPSSQDIDIPTMDLQLFQATVTEQKPVYRPLCLRSDSVTIANPHYATPWKV